MPTLTMPDLTPVFNSSTETVGSLVTWSTNVWIFVLTIAVFLGVFFLVKGRLLHIANSVLRGGRRHYYRRFRFRR